MKKHYSILIIFMVFGYSCKPLEIEIKEGPNCTDVDGNTYKSVFIGKQVWTTENLKTTRYSDGSLIPKVTADAVCAKLKTPAFCWMDNDSVKNNDLFGALYNWYAVDTLSNGNKNLCPIGWHVPTDAEWTTLTNAIGGELVAGRKMKEKGTEHWQDPNDATNESGFNALPSGHRGDSYGYFNGDLVSASYWSSTSNNELFAWYRLLTYGVPYIGRYSQFENRTKKNGFSVRCIKD